MDLSEYHGIKPNTGISKTAIEAAEEQLGIEFSPSYKEFLERYNGCSGNIGNNYVQLWRLELVLKMNRGMPEYIIIGSDGGEIRFAFDRKDMSVVTYKTDGHRIIKICNDFKDFFRSVERAAL